MLLLLLPCFTRLGPTQGSVAGAFCQMMRLIPCQTHVGLGTSRGERGSRSLARGHPVLRVLRINVKPGGESGWTSGLSRW